MKLVIDAYAWIEYFDGSDAGLKVKKFLEDKTNSIITNAITITEVISKTQRKNKNTKEVYDAILILSNIYNVDEELAKDAGIFHAEMKIRKKHFSIADTFVLLTAKKLNAKVLTGDEDFKNIKEAILIK